MLIDLSFLVVLFWISLLLIVFVLKLDKQGTSDKQKLMVICEILPVDAQKTYMTRQNTINTPAEFRKIDGKFVSNMRGILMLSINKCTHTLLMNTAEANAARQRYNYVSIDIDSLAAAAAAIVGYAASGAHPHIYLYSEIYISMNLKVAVHQ